jgi:hypothetical protein
MRRNSRYHDAEHVPLPWPTSTCTSTVVYVGSATAETPLMHLGRGQLAATLPVAEMRSSASGSSNGASDALSPVGHAPGHNDSVACPGRGRVHATLGRLDMRRRAKPWLGGIHDTHSGRVDSGRSVFVESGRRDLNPRPPDPQSGALPNCATSRPCLDTVAHCAGAEAGRQRRVPVRPRTRTEISIGVPVKSKSSRRRRSRNRR